MTRGSIGRERVVSGVLGLNSNHQTTPVANHQEHDLNNELLAVSQSISNSSRQIPFHGIQSKIKYS